MVMTIINIDIYYEHALTKNIIYVFFIHVFFYLSRSHAQTKMYFQFWLGQPKSDCIYHLPIDLKQKKIPFCSKPVGKW